jgi:hypothetical protein
MGVECFSFYCGSQLYWSLKNKLAYPKSQTNYHLKLGVSMHIIINFCKNYKNEKCRSQLTNKTNKKTYRSHMFSTMLVRIGSIEIWYNSPWLLTSSLATSMLVPFQILIPNVMVYRNMTRVSMPTMSPPMWYLVH